MKMFRKAMALILCMAMVLSVGLLTGAEAAEKNVVQVSTVDALLAAIAPNTEIVLAPGEYNLTDASNYGQYGGSHYHWESVYDGWELVVDAVEGLTIRSEDKDTASIVTEPRYADVMRFDSCGNVAITGVTVGHTPEKGSCAGGVLVFEYCTGVEILNSGLFGCGTMGVELYGCANVHVDGTDVYECSEGCISVNNSESVLFENCRFYRCTLWDGVFYVSSSRDVAFINSEVFENSGIYPEYGSLIYSGCAGVYLGGLDVHDNTFARLFEINVRGVVVEKCRFSENTGSFSGEEAPVTAEDVPLTRDALARMSLDTAQWEPAPAPESRCPETGEDGKIHVTNVDELLAAIGHDRTIYLEPGEYNLTDAENYGGYGMEFYRWTEEFDGAELVIQGVSGLTIEGPGKDQASIITVPRYANVLRFEDCTDLTLRGFLAGHTLEPGYCTGGVLKLLYCENVNIEECGLYGCGILGVWAMDCSHLYVTGTEIYECSYGAAEFESCEDVRITDCNVHDNGGPEYQIDGYCRDIYIEGRKASN